MSDSESEAKAVSKITTFVYDRDIVRPRPTRTDIPYNPTVTTYTYPGTENRRPRSSPSTNIE